MSVWESKQFLLEYTDLPLDLILTITSYLTHSALFFVEESTPQYPSDVLLPRKMFQSTGVYFSKQEALHHFGNYSFYRRIHKFGTVPFRYKLYVAQVEPNKVIAQRNMEMLEDNVYLNAYDFKTKLRKIVKKIRRLSFGKEECPFPADEHLLIENEKVGGSYLWKYTSYKDSLPEINEIPIDRIGEDETNGMLQIGWV